MPDSIKSTGKGKLRYFVACLSDGRFAVIRFHLHVITLGVLRRRGVRLAGRAGGRARQC